MTPNKVLADNTNQAITTVTTSAINVNNNNNNNNNNTAASTLPFSLPFSLLLLFPGLSNSVESKTIESRHENPTTEDKRAEMAFKTPEQRRMALVTRIFQKYDTNKDGLLSKVEAKIAGMTRLLEHFDKIDTNQDGQLSTDELNASLEKNRLTPAATTTNPIKIAGSINK